MAEVKEWVVVVGATGAFGSVMVERFLARGLGVVAVARSETTLQALASANTGLKPCVADIGQDSSIEAIRAALPGPVRMVVHGPGVSVGGGVLNIDTSALVDAVNIKVGGLLRLVRAVDAHLQTDDLYLVAGPELARVAAQEDAAVGVMLGVARIGADGELQHQVAERGFGLELARPLFHVDGAFARTPHRLLFHLGSFHFLPAREALAVEQRLQSQRLHFDVAELHLLAGVVLQADVSHLALGVVRIQDLLAVQFDQEVINLEL